MSEHAANHPQRDVLVDFGLGKLEPKESSWIEKHLSECPDCCDTLHNLADDTFTGIVRSVEPQPESMAEAASDTPASSLADVSIDTATVLSDFDGSPDRPDLPQDLLNHPRYRIVELIGKGGMGNVYRAEHTLMNRSVALKLINSQFVKHPQAVARFQREVQAAAQLAHPNIVTAFDAEQAGDVHFLAMEFVDGIDLAESVKQRGPLPVEEACDYIRQVADGLQHAYEKGMVHRDIKPHNLMLTSRELRVESPERQSGGAAGSGPSTQDSRLAVKILDFGLAGFATESALLDSETPATESTSGTATQHLTRIGSVMGTPDYIAPEQARDAHSADIRADIYSLGCTLCFLLKGEAPFEADSVIDKLKAHVEQEPPALNTLRDDVPAELADIVTRMMAKNPADRFQTPAEVSAALTAFSEKHTQPAQAPVKRSGKRRIVTAVFAGLVLLLAGVIIVVTTQGNFEVRSEIDGVQVTVSKDGKTFRVLDVNSGTSVFWLPSNEFQVKARGDVDVSVSRKSVRVNWMSRQVIQIRPVNVADTKPQSAPDEDGRSKFFQSISRVGTGESILKQISVVDSVAGSDVVFVGVFGSAPLHSPPYWAHGARIRMTATREIAGRYLSHLKGAVEATARTHDVRLLSASFGETGGDVSRFAVGYSHDNLTGEISGHLETSRAIDGSDNSAWDILLTVKEWRGKTRPKSIDKANYPILKHAHDGHLFGSNGKLAVSSDGKLLATCGNAVRIWNAADGTPYNVLNLPKATSAVFLKHDPSLIAIGTTFVGEVDKNVKGKVFICNYKNGAFVQVLPIAAGEVHSLALSPDGLQLAIGAYVNETGQALLWDLKNRETRVLVDEEPVRHVAFTPDGKFVVSATANERGTLRLFDVGTGKQVAEHRNVLSVRKFIRAIGISPDSKHLAVAGGNWREKDGRLLLLGLPDLTIQRREMRGDTEVRSVSFSPNGRLLATGGGSGNGEVFLLDADTLQERARFIAYGPRPAVLRQIVSDIAFTSDGRSLFTVADRESAKQWILPESLVSAGAGPNEANRSDTDARDETAHKAGWRPEYGSGPIKAGINLINDPSLEGTAAGEAYPKTWGNGNLIPKDAWRFQVVEGGRTGKRAWMIEGDGDAATVPTNRPPVDRAFRYAARGWVKVESGMARLGLLYFDKNRRYLKTSHSTATIPRGEWHQLTMLDDFANHPEAAYVSLALVMVGKGKAVFDDLELLAFDAKNLPENFELEYGDMATKTAALFDRWVGRWESTSVYKPTTAMPDGQTIKGQVVVRKILDDRFLMWQFIDDAGATESIAILCYDEYAGGYHIWLFGSGGEAYERIGQWDAASQTLALELKPPGPRVTGSSTDRFVNNDHIESTILVQANGQITRDIRATWIRKSAEVPEEFTLSSGPVDGSDELAVLNRMVGDWDSVSIQKPAEWTPDGGRLTAKIKREWILNGRFVLARETHSNGQEGLTLFGFDPKQKAYRVWQFNSEGAFPLNPSKGVWSESQQTLSYVTELDGGKILDASVHFASQNREDWKIKVTAGAGKVYLDLDVSATRRKAQ